MTADQVFVCRFGSGNGQQEKTHTLWKEPDRVSSEHDAVFSFSRGLGTASAWTTPHAAAMVPAVTSKEVNPNGSKAKAGGTRLIK
jgi:hypothetical protein